MIPFSEEDFNRCGVIVLAAWEFRNGGFPNPQASLGRNLTDLERRFYHRLINFMKGSDKRSAD